MQAVTLSIQIFLYIAVGYLARRLKVVDEPFTSKLAKLQINIIIPCMILRAFHFEYTMEELSGGLLLVLLGLAFMLFMLLVGHIVFLLWGKCFSARLFRFGIAFSNYTYMGLPVMEALYGEAGVFSMAMLTLSARFLFYTLPKPLLSVTGGFERVPLGKQLLGIATPPAVAAALGISLLLLNIRIPNVIYPVVDNIGRCCSPLGMMLCGMILARAPFSDLTHPSYYVLPVCKNMLVPPIAVGIALLLGMSGLSAHTLVLFGALPVASMLPVFTMMYSHKDDGELEAACAVTISTLLSIVTIPLWAYLTGLIFPM